MADQEREARRDEDAPERGAPGTEAPDRGDPDTEDPEEGPGPHENTDAVTLADSGMTGAEGPREASGDGPERSQVGPREAERQDAARRRGSERTGRDEPTGADQPER